MQTEITPTKPQVILLDVYETLLDMRDVERKVNDLLDTSKGYILWFELLLQYCFVDSCTNQFHPFADIAKATMQMTAKKLGRTVDESDIDAMLEWLKYLPVKDDVREGLSALNDLGYRIAALTNTPEEAVCERMERSGLISYFEVVLSAEGFKKYKPSLDVYNWAAEKLKVDKTEILMVSSHDWDIAGASCAGMKTTYLKQSKQMLYLLAPKPDITCSSLMDLANLLQAAGESKQV